MRYTVVPVSTRRELKHFLDLPEAVYRDDPHWVPPLRSEVRRTLDPVKNPYFDNAAMKLFICYRDGIPSARVCIVIDRRQEERAGNGIAFFGFFESQDDPETVRILFSEAERFCRLHGALSIEGPFNPNHYSELGLQASHFDADPVFFQPHNPPYYARLLAAAGFVHFKTVHTRGNQDIREYLRCHPPPDLPPRRNGYTIRPFDMRRMERDLEAVRTVFNDAFSGNWRFTPVSSAEYRFSAGYLRYITKPDLVQIVEHEGVPVGVLQCVLDVNPILKPLRGRFRLLQMLLYPLRKRGLDRVIIFAAGIRREYQRSVVPHLLFNAMAAIARRYSAVETTWMSEDNHVAIRTTDRMGLAREREFHLFRKDLRAAGAQNGMKREYDGIVTGA